MDTVTSFFNFQNLSKARSSQININFGNFRGDRIPINSDTATASTNTHHLGSTEYRWRTSYCAAIDFRSSTLSTSLVLSGDTAATLGAYDLDMGGVTYLRIGHYGIRSDAFGARENTTTAGNVSVSTTFSGTITSSSGQTILSLDITTKGGPVSIGVFPGPFSVNTATSESYVKIQEAAAATNSVYGIAKIVRDDGLIFTVTTNLKIALIDATNSTAGAFFGDFPATMISAIDHPTAGSHAYHLVCNVPSNSGTSYSFNNIRLAAWEL